MSDWMSQLGGMLQKYASSDNTQNAAHDDFDQVAQHAPASSLAEGLAAAFRSNQTPAFSDMITNLFNNGNGQQRASLLNMLAPVVISQLTGNRGGGGGILGALLSGGGGPLGSLLGGGGGGGGLGGVLGALANGQQVTPEMAEQVSPDEVRVLAQRAEESDPSIIDTVSDFYAQHPTLVKTLGAAALTIAINQIAKRR